MNGKLPDHITLQLTVLIGHIIIRHLILRHVTLLYPPLPILILLFSVFFFEITENDLLVRHGGGVGTYQVIYLVLAVSLRIIKINLAGLHNLIAMTIFFLIVLIDFILLALAAASVIYKKCQQEFIAQSFIIYVSRDLI